MTTLLMRVIPLPLRSAQRAKYVFERNVMVYRRGWMVIFSGIFEPLFYLFSIGVGLGGYIGDVTGPGGELVSYTAFVAPALLASSAMNGAVFESTMNIFFKMKYQKAYDAMLSTPIGVPDIAVGEISWSLVRGALYAASFMVVMTGLGYVESWWGLLAVPAAVLIGFAFGAVGMACSTFMRSWQDFDYVTVVTLPLFLFSATFFPLDQYPPIVQQLTRFSPLYHSVELIRALTFGVFDWSLVGHIAVLIGMGALGTMVVGRRLHRLLLT